MLLHILRRGLYRYGALAHDIRLLHRLLDVLHLLHGLLVLHLLFVLMMGVFVRV